MLEMEVRYQSYYYQVAGLRFCLRLPVNDPICNRLQHYEPFETDNENNEGLLFSLQVSPESTCVPQSKLPFLTTFDEEDKTISLYHNQQIQEDGCPYDIIYSLKASPDSVCFWRQGAVLVRDIYGQKAITTHAISEWKMR